MTRIAKMKTRGNTGRQKYLTKKSNSKRSIKTTINSSPRAHRSPRPKVLRRNVKPVKKEEVKFDMLPKLSRSKSDSCIRYNGENADSSSVQLHNTLTNIHVTPSNASPRPNKQRMMANQHQLHGHCLPEFSGHRLKSKNSQIFSLSKPSLKETLQIAPPPAGYFVRDDLSTEESGVDRICHEYPAVNENVPPCTFGYTVSENQHEPNGVFYSQSHSPRVKKRHVGSSLKEPPKRKLAKGKKRNTGRKSIEYKDQSPKKTKGDESRSRSKKGFEMKTGFVFKNDSKNGRGQPIRYKQKVLDLKNSKLFQTMGSLPVSMDSVLYYYEPQGKPKVKKNSSQNKNVDKKSRGIAGNEERCTKEMNKGLSGIRICRRRVGDLSLNKNCNACHSDDEMNGSDESVPTKSTTKMSHPETTFVEIAGNATLMEHLQPSAGGDDDDGIHKDVVDHICSLNFSVNSSPNDNQMMSDIKTDKCPMIITVEESSPQYGLDLMVDDILESAVKEEAYERRLAEDPSDQLAGENGHVTGKATKSATFSLDIKNNVMSEAPQKLIEKDEEKTIGSVSKHAGPRSELAKLYKTFKRASSSSPNLSALKKGERTAGGKQGSNSTDLPQRTKSTPQTHKLPSPPKTPSLPATPSTASPKSKSDELPSQSSPQTDATSDWLPDAIKETVPEVEIVQKAKETVENVKEEVAPGSILRKSKSVPQGEKAPQPSSINSPRKRKATGNLKKSQSMSPLKATRTGSNSGSPTQHSGETLRKKYQSMSKKNKKKVRIVVDVSALSAAANAANAANASPKGETVVYSGDEQNQKITGESDIDRSCDLSDRMEPNTDDELRETDNEEAEKAEEELRETDVDDGDKTEEEEVYNAVCGLTEVMKDMKEQEKVKLENLKTSPKVKGTKKIKKTVKTKKVVKPKEEKPVVVKAKEPVQETLPVKRDDSKAKLGLKRKRYQLKKAVDLNADKTSTKQNVSKEITEAEHIEVKDYDTPVDPESMSTKIKKFPSPQISKPPKPSPAKKYLSPTGLRRKTEILDPRVEGSSVDAPIFNARRESVVRASKSIASAASKSKAIEVQANGAKQRVKQARESFGKPNRFKSNPSPPVSPQMDGTTDLDLVCGKKQSSPAKGGVFMGSKRGETKQVSTKAKSKMEMEGASVCKEDPPEEICEESPPVSPTRAAHPRFSDPVEMNLLNLGLQWVGERIKNRLSFFKADSENQNEESSSPSCEALPSVIEHEV